MSEVLFSLLSDRKKKFLYRMIQKMKLYFFSMLFDQYSTSIMLMEFRAELWMSET